MVKDKDREWRSVIRLPVSPISRYNRHSSASDGICTRCISVCIPIFDAEDPRSVHIPAPCSTGVPYVPSRPVLHPTLSIGRSVLITIRITEPNCCKMTLFYILKGFFWTHLRLSTSSFVLENPTGLVLFLYLNWKEWVLLNVYFLSERYHVACDIGWYINVVFSSFFTEHQIFGWWMIDNKFYC